MRRECKPRNPREIVRTARKDNLFYDINELTGGAVRIRTPIMGPHNPLKFHSIIYTPVAVMMQQKRSENLTSADADPRE
jgi:hypothetical protein